MLENKENIIKGLDQIFNNDEAFKNIEAEDISKLIKEKGMLDEITNIVAKQIYNETKERKQYSKKYIIQTYPEVSSLKKYDNIEKLIGFLYYEYHVSLPLFKGLVRELIKKDSDVVQNDLVKEKIINVENDITLTELGIKIAVSYGYSIEDLSKEIFVNKIKQKIKK